MLDSSFKYNQKCLNQTNYYPVAEAVQKYLHFMLVHQVSVKGSDVE